MYTVWTKSPSRTEPETIPLVLSFFIVVLVVFFFFWVFDHDRCVALALCDGTDRDTIAIHFHGPIAATDWHLGRRLDIGQTAPSQLLSPLLQSLDAAFELLHLIEFLL